MSYGKKNPMVPIPSKEIGAVWPVPINLCNSRQAGKSAIFNGIKEAQDVTDTIETVKVLITPDGDRSKEMTEMIINAGKMRLEPIIFSGDPIDMYSLSAYKETPIPLPDFKPVITGDPRAEIQEIKEAIMGALSTGIPRKFLEGDIMDTGKPTAEEVLAQMINDDVRDGKNKCCKCGKTAQNFHQSLMLWACDTHSGVSVDTSSRSMPESPTATPKFKAPVAPILNRAERRKLQKGRRR